MSTFLVKKSQLHGSVSVPSSKSHTLRAILFGALAKGKTTIKNFLDSSDAQAMIQACRLLGAKVDVHADLIEMEGLNGVVDRVEDVINSGNSGLVLRLVGAIAALSPHYTIITGDHSIRHQRPVSPLLEGLQQLGVWVASSRGDGYAPIIIKGPLRSGTATITGEDSQPVSALLIASSLVEGPTEIIVKNVREQPWLALTLDWFDFLGIKYTHQNFSHYHLEGGGRFEGFEYKVPGDWSSAAFPIVAALITQSELTLENLNIHDPQGDKAIIEVLQQMGAQIEIDEKGKRLHVKKTETLQGITIDLNPLIDAIVILAVVGCFAEGETRLTNAAIARKKECDRIHCVAQELSRMGALIEEKEDGLIIKRSHLRGARVFSHADHRMAMSLTVAALAAEGETSIEGVECIQKTFPNFLGFCQRLGAQIEEKSL